MAIDVFVTLLVLVIHCLNRPTGQDPVVMSVSVD